MEGIYSLSWADHLLAAIITFVIPAYALLRSQPAIQNLKLNERIRLAIYYSNSAALLLLALIVTGVWLAQGRSLASLGFQDPIPGKEWVYLSILFLALYALDVLSNLMLSAWREKRRIRWQQLTPFLPTNDKELFHFSFTVVPSAALNEEVVYRGFLILYCLNFFPSTPAGEISAVVVPAFIFAAVHRYQGFWAVFKIFLLAILFGLIFLLSRSLWAVIIIHFLINIFGGILGRYLFGDKGKTA